MVPAYPRKVTDETFEMGTMNVCDDCVEKTRKRTAFQIRSLGFDPDEMQKVTH